MLWKRFLLARATRWTTCAALVVSADLSLNDRFSSSSLTAQEKKEAVKDEKTKKTADELRKELEEKLKGIELTDPKFDEITKEYEKLIKEAIGKIPSAPNFQQGPIIVGPNQFRNQQMIDELRRRQQALERGGLLPIFPNQQNPFILDFPNRPTNGRFGIVIEAVPDVVREQLDIPANSGQVVREVTPGSVAEKVGMKVNDIVVEFNGKAVPGDTREFVQMVLDHKADVETTAVVIRKGKKETIKGIKLPEVKAAAPQFAAPALGADAVGDVEKLLKGLIENEIQANEFPVIGGGELKGSFSLYSSRNGVEISISGSRSGAEKEIKSIKIKDGEETIEAASVEKVPEKYREEVQKLLKGVK